jgi:DnaK suppressor protein
MKPCQKEILKAKMEKTREDTLRKWSEKLDELQVKGDFMDEDFSNRQNMLQFRIKSREKFFLKKIEDTLSKIESDDYGICHECGVDIGFKRLMARPMADKCIDCKEIEERQEGNIFYEKKSHTLGKVIENSSQENVVFLEKKRSEKVNALEVVIN